VNIYQQVILVGDLYTILGISVSMLQYSG